MSIIISCYNHANYVHKAVESALSQSFLSFQVLISDDASSDNSWDVISEFDDPRIKIFRQSFNLGPVGNLRFLVNNSEGELIAILNSDDYWHPEKLLKQVASLDAMPATGACFTWSRLVDSFDKELSGPEAIYNNIFRQCNRSQGEWLNYFFTNGNCICHPSALIRKNLYSTIGSYASGLRQLPDFEMWIRLVKFCPIHIIEEDLVFHRRDGKNTSADTPENTARGLFELTYIFENYFDDLTGELFSEAFQKDFRTNLLSHSTIQTLCEQFMLLLNSTFAPQAGQIAAAKFFIKHSKSEFFEEMLFQKYRFSISDFYSLTKSISESCFLKGELNFQLLQQAKDELQQAKDETNKAREQALQVQESLERIQKSTIWRMTKPTRVALDMARGILGSRNY